ncbi:MAG: hypothetical protein H0X29_05975 [Parachlamydiaceae bacterium]|nr:hypothetical protein [Parachlamydiaceae bacterium]
MTSANFDSVLSTIRLHTTYPNNNDATIAAQTAIGSIIAGVDQLTQEQREKLYSVLRELTGQRKGENKDSEACIIHLVDSSIMEQAKQLLGILDQRKQPSGVEQVKPVQLSSAVDDDNLPSAEAVVDMVIQKEKELWNKALLAMASKPSRLKWDIPAKTEDEWEKIKQTYFEIEEQLRNDKSPPSWDVAGGLDWGMSLAEMQAAITEKFVQMAPEDRVLTEKSFKDQARETFYPLTGPGLTNLTRIWGADFLKENLTDISTLRAVKNYLVINDSATEIEIQLVRGTSLVSEFPMNYPVISAVENAGIFSKIIHGEPKASSYRSSPPLVRLQYADFSDPGNIREDAAGIGWVIDTELKSFNPPRMGTFLCLVQDYALKRFEALTSSHYHTIRIPISTLNI